MLVWWRNLFPTLQYKIFSGSFVVGDTSVMLPLSVQLWLPGFTLVFDIMSGYLFVFYEVFASWKISSYFNCIMRPEQASISCSLLKQETKRCLYSIYKNSVFFIFSAQLLQWLPLYLHPQISNLLLTSWLSMLLGMG